MNAIIAIGCSLSLIAASIACGSSNRVDVTCANVETPLLGPLPNDSMIGFSVGDIPLFLQTDAAIVPSSSETWLVFKMPVGVGYAHTPNLTISLQGPGAVYFETGDIFKSPITVATDRSVNGFLPMAVRVSARGMYLLRVIDVNSEPLGEVTLAVCDRVFPVGVSWKRLPAAS